MTPSPTIGAYDAEADADKLAKSIRKWGDIGFMRGFAGIRTEALPKGKTSLPSAAFHEAATANITAGEPDQIETERRQAYIDAVEERLRHEQAASINDHFKKAAVGQLLDAAVAATFLLLVCGLIMRVGPFHPVTILLIFLMGTKIIFLHWSVRKVVRVAQEAFRSRTDDIRLPW